MARVWRRNFVTIIAINGWADLRARRDANLVMEGAANWAVSDLNVETFTNVTLTLDAYEERFIPRAAAQLARAEFDRARQASNETVLQWHTRLREIFSRAYPERAATADRPLIDKFTIGLVDSALARHMLDHQPATFAQALQMAQSKQAMEDLMAAQYPSQAPSLSAMSHQGGRPAGTSGCWYCQEPGHQRSDCSKFMQQTEIFCQNISRSTATLDQEAVTAARVVAVAVDVVVEDVVDLPGPTTTWNQLPRTRNTRRAGFGPATTQRLRFSTFIPQPYCPTPMRPPDQLLPILPAHPSQQ